MASTSSRRRLLLSLLWTALSPTICAQPEPPSRPNGIQLGDPAHGLDIIVPPSMTQCESFLVFYNITNTSSPYIAFYHSDIFGLALLTLRPPPAAVGYIDWTCNIPSGHPLVVAVRSGPDTLRGQDYIVQSSKLSSCLTDITTAYSLVGYGDGFRSFTSASNQHFGSVSYPYQHGTTTRFPTASLSTISANPGLIAKNPFSTTLKSSIAVTSTTPLVTTIPTASTSAGTSPKPKKANKITTVAIVLSVTGGILMLGLVILLLLRRLRRWIESDDKAKWLESNPLTFPPPSRDQLDRGDVEHTVPTPDVRMSSDHPIPMPLLPDINPGNLGLAIPLEHHLSPLTSLQRQMVLAYLAATDTARPHTDTSGSSTPFPQHSQLPPSSFPSRPDPSPDLEALLGMISALTRTETRAVAASDADRPGTEWGEKPVEDRSVPRNGV